MGLNNQTYSDSNGPNSGNQPGEPTDHPKSGSKLKGKTLVVILVFAGFIFGIALGLLILGKIPNTSKLRSFDLKNCTAPEEKPIACYYVDLTFEQNYKAICKRTPDPEKVECQYKFQQKPTMSFSAFYQKIEKEFLLQSNNQSITSENEKEFSVHMANAVTNNFLPLWMGHIQSNKIMKKFPLCEAENENEIKTSLKVFLVVNENQPCLTTKDQFLDAFFAAKAKEDL